MRIEEISRRRTAVNLAASFVAHPGQLAWVPRWLHERRARPLELRQPWWPYLAQVYVDQELPPHAQVFEFGGGGSTLWLEDRGSRVSTVEHDAGWFRTLDEQTGDSVTLLLCPATDEGRVSSVVEQGYFDDYVDAVSVIDDQSCDLLVVDGRARVACGEAGHRKVKPGGLLLLDDSDRPRYRALHDVLQGWSARQFHGLKAGSAAMCRTTIWRRPS